MARGTQNGGQKGINSHEIVCSKQLLLNKIIFYSTRSSCTKVDNETKKENDNDNNSCQSINPAVDTTNRQIQRRESESLNALDTVCVFW